MYLIVDYSCYENMDKLRDYRVHIFTKSLAVFPKIVVGDVIRLHYVKLDINEKQKLDFKVYNETDVVVFPWNEQERPICSGTHFTFTQDDIAIVQNLRKWSLERFKQHAVERFKQHAVISTPEPKIIILSVSLLL